MPVCKKTGVSLGESDLQKLDALAKEDAGEGEEPNRSRTLRKLIRAETARRERIREQDR